MKHFWMSGEQMLVIIAAVALLHCCDSTKVKAQGIGPVQQPIFTMISAATGPEPPAGFLQIWIKPESLAGMTNGQRIVTWTDSSPYLHHGTNATAGSGPVVVTNALGDYSAGRFIGGGGYILVFATNNAYSVLRNVPGSTLYMVLTPHGFAGMYPFSVKDSTGSKLRMGPNGSSYFYRLIGKSIDADADQIGSYSAGPGPSDTNHFFLFNLVIDYPGRSWAMYTNGTAFVSQSGMGWTAANTSDTDTAAATPPAIGNVNYTGNVLEMLLYSTNHSPTDRLEVEMYLTNKYGVYTNW